MEVRINSFIDGEGKIYSIGDTVTIHFANGGGLGSCLITSITNTGIHYTQGKKEKSMRFKNIHSLILHDRNKERKCTSKTDVGGGCTEEYAKKIGNI